jgi:hypothetical protein
VNVLGNNNFEFAMPDISGGLASQISTLLANKYNQSTRDNCRTLFKVS